MDKHREKRLKAQKKYAMNSSRNRTERRRAPRIKQRIPLKIKHDDYDLVAQTHNISCLGVYCTVSKHIPPFSILALNLLLPLIKKNRKVVCNVQCQGVVVRTEENPVDSKEYNIAIYFERLKQSDKAKLLQYIKQHLR